jgi:ABC-type branched-subunit amino acid transport system ATPase component
MTVCENLLMESYMRGDGRVVTDKDLDFVLTTFPAERLNQDASTLSGGEQQMCAIGRGIMANPLLLTIDELSLGLSPKLVGELSKTLVEIKRPASQFCSWSMIWRLRRGLPPPASCPTLAVSCCPGRPPNSSSEA